MGLQNWLDGILAARNELIANLIAIKDKYPEAGAPIDEVIALFSNATGNLAFLPIIALSEIKDAVTTGKSEVDPDAGQD